MDHTTAVAGIRREEETMRISVSDAKGQLTDLVKRAEAGDEVVLTRRGREVARLVPIVAVQGSAGRRALMEKVRASAARKATPGPDAAHSQDFLYGEDGLPA
jgi:prevent-host-death family protein